MSEVRSLACRRLPRVAVLAAAVLLALYLSFFVASLAAGTWQFVPDGALRRLDFLAFWTAARMALAGEAAQAYDGAAFVAAYEAAGGTGFNLPLGWHNPPSFLLLLVPFGAVPYLAGFVAWIFATAAIFALAIRAALPGVKGAGLVALAFPATILCAWNGQNGFLIAALFGFALARLDTNPVSAGVFIGLLSIKPHFGVLLPVLLATGRHWRCFASASVTVLVLLALSAAAFGTEAWLAFAPSLVASGNAYLGDFVPDTLQTVYGLVARARGAGSLAWVAHGAVAAAAAAVAIFLWSRPASLEVRAASAIAASFLIPPYAFPYDAVAVAMAAAFLARAAWCRGALPGEVPLLFLACCVPLLGLVVRSGVYGFLAYSVLLLLALRRHGAEARGQSEALPAPCREPI